MVWWNHKMSLTHPWILKLGTHLSTSGNLQRRDKPHRKTVSTSMQRPFSLWQSGRQHKHHDFHTLDNTPNGRSGRGGVQAVDDPANSARMHTWQHDKCMELSGLRILSNSQQGATHWLQKGEAYEKIIQILTLFFFLPVNIFLIN